MLYSELARMFNLTDWRENSKSAILLDLYLYSIQFARDNKFNREQTSVFFSIVKKVHEVCTGSFKYCILDKIKPCMLLPCMLFG